MPSALLLVNRLIRTQKRTGAAFVTFAKNRYLNHRCRCILAMAQQPRKDSDPGCSSTMPPSNTTRFIDIGVNLLDGMYSGSYHDKTYHAPDLEAVLQRAWSAGVDKIIITAGNLEEAKAALALARTHERLFSTVGVHPTRCGEFAAHPQGPDAYLAALHEVIRDGQQDGKVVAVGECGLDFDRLMFCDAETQKTWFEAQFALARASQLPVFLHLRAACPDFLAIVRRHKDDFPAGGVVHSFDGSADELQAVLEVERLHVGINGCSLKTAENLAVAAAVPVGRLHLETDAPWCDIRATHAGAGSLTPSPFKARDKRRHDPAYLVKGRNEPCNIRQVLEVVAAARGVEEAQLAEQVYENSAAMFFRGKR